MRNMIIILGLLSLVSLIASCGGGGADSGASTDNGASADAPMTNAEDQVTTKAFAVSLNTLLINRPSNGDSVSVDIEGISSSGTLTIVQ